MIFRGRIIGSEESKRVVYCIDNITSLDVNTFVVRGWCFSKDYEDVLISIEGINASVHRFVRNDLLLIFPQYEKNLKNCGFEIRFQHNNYALPKFYIIFSDGRNFAKVSSKQKGLQLLIFKKIIKKFAKEFLVFLHFSISRLDIGKYRKQTLEQLLRHSNLFYGDKSDRIISYQRNNSDVKYVAFYLPQFHPIKENDEWWGKGFTEWRNVARALPMYMGHYQPHIPSDLGFYDLRIARTIENQVNLARRFGIYGFCFHYYWFGGRRLLEEPLDIFLEHQEIDFPFCICWANETWSRRWDGSENDILMKQDHTEETDLRFIQDAVELFRDKRYIRINDRPVLIIYRPDLFPSLPDTIEHWKTYCKDQGMQPPFVIGALTFDIEDPTIFGCDAGVEFPPHGLRLRQITYKKRMLNPKFSGIVFEARNIIQDKLYLENTPFLKFRTVFPGWDNTPRKPEKGFVFEHTSPAFYKEWLKDVSQYTIANMAPEHRFVFINAWNEWAEGAHLEPDFQYGTGYLEATAEVLKELRTRGDQPASE